tara:strand:- start:3884 stop:4645 length:762 start_codon:yes stop_codon:yes gene_type:complete
MSNIVIIGTGNVSHHFCKAILKSKKLELIQLFGRKKILPENFNQKISYTNNLKKIKQANFYIICVNDDAILKISNKLKVKNAIVLHTSGSSNMKLLSKHKNYGVIYPLQTFSKNKEVLFNNIPIIIEASSKIILNKIKKVSLQLSNKILECNSNQRTLIHISAVFTNNFSNYMNIISEEILLSQDIDPEILKPLIEETSDKLNYLSAKESQTGPAIRNDQITIEKHLNLLKETKYYEIYNNLSEKIKKLKNEL